MFVPARLVLFAAFCLTLLSACGSRSGDIVGRVTYKDKPVNNSEVILLGKNGVPLPPVAVSENGAFEIKDVPYGDYFVAVVPIVKDFKSPAELRKEWKEKGKDPPPGSLVMAKQYPFPEKYALHETSGLTVSIIQASTRLDIPMAD